MRICSREQAVGHYAKKRTFRKMVVSNYPIKKFSLTEFQIPKKKCFRFSPFAKLYQFCFLTIAFKTDKVFNRTRRYRAWELRGS